MSGLDSCWSGFDQVIYLWPTSWGDMLSNFGRRASHYLLLLQLALYYNIYPLPGDGFSFSFFLFLLNRVLYPEMGNSLALTIWQLGRKTYLLTYLTTSVSSALIVTRSGLSFIGHIARRSLSPLHMGGLQPRLRLHLIFIPLSQLASACLIAAPFPSPCRPWSFACFRLYLS